MVIQTSITSIFLVSKALVLTVIFFACPKIFAKILTNFLEDENSYPAQKVVWGNSTLFNCDSNPECPRDEIYAMTNKLVSKGQEGKTVWKVQKEFIDKFESLPYSVILTFLNII